jgi:hypothetical protein
MAKLELFQAFLNKMLSDIRDDAVDAFTNPPNGVKVEDLSDEDIEKLALEYHQKGETGNYLYFLAMLEMRILDKKIQ